MLVMKFPVALLAALLVAHQATADTRQCTQVTASRQGLKDAALWVAHTGKSISYTQSSPNRWSAINKRVCPKAGVPASADCSAFVTWLYWSAFGKGTDHLNGQGWKAGYTGTMEQHGVRVSLDKAQPGDVVLYGSPAFHAALYIGNGQVVSYGRTGPAKVFKVNDMKGFSQVRSYPQFF